MQRQSPPKHRHDGTSPLPLGMDWSPPPRKWIKLRMQGHRDLESDQGFIEQNKLASFKEDSLRVLASVASPEDHITCQNLNGRDTVWPHDPCTGWSYCITIPSWAVLPKSRESDPVVGQFYRVQVGIQSPEGVTTTRVVLRRFNDFLKLFAAVSNQAKKIISQKESPPISAKGTLANEKQSTFRRAFQDENQRSTETNPSTSSTISSLQIHPSSSQSVIAVSGSHTSDYGSDTAYETSEIGTPSFGRDNSSEVGVDEMSLDEDLTGPIERLVKYGMSNIDEGLFMGQAILEQLEGLPRHNVHARETNRTVENNTGNGNSSRAPYLAGNTMELLSEPDHGKVFGHARKLSNESVESEISSLKGSDSSNSGFPNTFGNGLLDLPRGAEVSKAVDSLGNTELQFSSDVQLVLPLDYHQKMNRVLINMQHRLVTAKTDMEDLISRLNQEVAVKDYLTTKVKDLEVELETTKQKSKETLQQAIMSEKDRINQMQWDMEELRRKSYEMEMKLKSQQYEKPDTESTSASSIQGKDVLLQELDATKQQLVELLKQHRELEVKSKSDIKILVKEVKSLRSSQGELKQQLSRSLEEKTEAERLLEQEIQNRENSNSARRKLLHECEILRNQLQECSININEDKIILGSTSMPDALDHLTSSDNQIGLLAEVLILSLMSKMLLDHLFLQYPVLTPFVLTIYLFTPFPKSYQARLFSEDNESASGVANTDKIDDDTKAIDLEMKKLLRNVFVDNARLRKQVNSVSRYALKMENSCERMDEASSEQIVQSKTIER
ncbi:hypothetical protein RJ639_028815 [Escallonia herrerae]|uniref:PX domain-containing protein n=1 Tax=Escallonia herrerae TaxID=1293975 RepID=A0AA88X6N7_9ASTE|nr:hypothetical protein RJ639_028815 [Escallonia herrerae]